MHTLVIIVAIIAVCFGFFIGAIVIGFLLSERASDAVLNLIGNLVTFVGVGAGAYLGIRQLNLGVSQIAENARQASLERTMHLTSTIEAKYLSFDSVSWVEYLKEFDFLLPIATLPKSRVEEFINKVNKEDQYKELVGLINLIGEVFHGIEIGLYNKKYIFGRGFQFFFDVWRWAWPLIVAQREREKVTFPNSIPEDMLDLENFLRKYDRVFVPLPEITQD